MAPAEPAFTLRGGRPQDAQAILEAHRSAVRGTAARSYGEEVIDSWAPVEISPERVQAFARWIGVGEEVILVAEDRAQQIIGFGSIIPKNSELRAVYVRADHGRRGIGRAILARLEELARQAGLSELQMEASINAANFYEAMGYTVVGGGEHTLQSGVRMACVRMRKTL